LGYASLISRVFSDDFLKSPIGFGGKIGFYSIQDTFQFLPYVNDLQKQSHEIVRK